MSSVLETLNRGNVEDCGFVFGDVACVRLGALPSMPIGQFAEYSTETIIQILESQDLDPSLKNDVVARIALNCGRVLQAYIYQTDMKLHPEDKKDEIVQHVVQNVIPRIASEVGNPAREYSSNPFVFENGQLTISNFYEMSVPKFVAFAGKMLAGGMHGWNPRVVEIPEEVIENAKKLMNQFSTHN